MGTGADEVLEARAILTRAMFPAIDPHLDQSTMCARDCRRCSGVPQPTGFVAATSQTECGRARVAVAAYRALQMLAATTTAWPATTNGSESDWVAEHYRGIRGGHVPGLPTGVTAARHALTALTKLIEPAIGPASGSSAGMGRPTRSRYAASGVASADQPRPVNHSSAGACCSL
jgi:hypothetical protein